MEYAAAAAFSACAPAAAFLRVQCKTFIARALTEVTLSLRSGVVSAIGLIDS